MKENKLKAVRRRLGMIPRSKVEGTYTVFDLDYDGFVEIYIDEEGTIWNTNIWESIEKNNE